jgi:hypothetical protein
VKNILGPVVDSDTELVRYDVHHALPNNTNSLIGTDLFSWSISSLIPDILEVRRLRKLSEIHTDLYPDSYNI